MSQPRRLPVRARIALLACCLASWCWQLALLPAQEAESQPAIRQQDSAQPAATSAAPGAVKSSQAKPAESKSPGPQPGEAKPANGKPGDNKPAEAKPADGKDNEAKPDEKSGPVKRPTEPKAPPNPAELKVRPADDGLISFSFKNQPWPDVLQWLADISNLSLHWEEAPGGFLDLTTRGRYTPEEVRDLLNSVLLAKGYTVLRSGEILVVANLKTLDSSLVPRVTPEELDERGTYELVKTFFDLNSLVAQELVEEIKPMLSPHGKISALKTTNRLDVLETAGNLRRIRELIGEEQSESTQETLVRQFKLKHTRATEVLQTLNTLLGIKSDKSSDQPLTPQQQQMMQQQAMMMAQQRAQQGGKAPDTDDKQPKVYLAVNSRENTILANAPPDKMAIIEQTVLAVDVPVDRSQSLLTNLPRLRIYRLSGVAPDTIVKVLQDIGGLDPATRLEIDSKNSAIIAYATLVDHVMIQSLVDRLDGTGRKFEVIQLRMLRAENVAGSIAMLMTGPPETNTQRRSPYYFDYGYGRGGSDSNDKSDKFQVDADIEHNRLLLRANDAELAEVRELLVKLGEISPNGRNESRVRTLPAMPTEDTKALLERLRNIWPSMGENELRIDPVPPSSSGKPAATPPASQQPSQAEPRDTTEQRPVRPSPRGSSHVPLVQFALQQSADPLAESPDDDAPQALPPASSEPPLSDPALPVQPPAERPFSSQPFGDALPRDDRFGGEPLELRAGQPGAPIHITIGPQGLVMTSADTAALDRLEQLIGNLAPQRSGFKIFTLHHTYAKDVALLLEDVFKEGDEKKSDGTDIWERIYFGYSSSSQKPKTPNSLSKRRPLAFVPDPVTNTILVQGADAAQLAEIEELIGIYDRVEPADSNAVRRQQMVTLQYSSAKQIAEVVKEVYRDLLSPNDKSLANPNQQQQQKQEQQGYVSSLYSYLANADNEADKELPRFKGLLSVGVDPLSNSVVVSAPQGLLVEVVAMVEDLDLASRPLRPVTQVLRMNQPGAAHSLREALAPGSSSTRRGSPAGSDRSNGQNGGDNDNGNGRRNGATRNGPSSGQNASGAGNGQNG